MAGLDPATDPRGPSAWAASWMHGSKLGMPDKVKRLKNEQIIIIKSLRHEYFPTLFS